MSDLQPIHVKKKLFLFLTCRDERSERITTCKPRRLAILSSKTNVKIRPTNAQNQKHNCMAYVEMSVK